MHLPTLFTVVLAATSASGCTFTMYSEQNNNSGGGGGFQCSLSIRPKNRKTPIGGRGFSKIIECHKSCDKVHYRGKTWKFCHSGLTPWSDQRKSAHITIQETDNRGYKLLVWPPGGHLAHRSGEGPFSSWEENYWWRDGIHC